MSVKKIVGKLHLYLGLLSGVVVFMLGITGCLYVFYQEINSVVHADKWYVENTATETKPLSELWDIAAEAFEGDTIFRTTVYQQPANKAWTFSVYKPGPDDAVTFFESIDKYEEIYIDPYTGEILGRRDLEHDFFTIVKMLHWSLLLKTEYGQPIIGWSTFIFVVLLITGMVLWWPKNKKNRKQRFTIKTKGSWRRINYDMHNVLGFYVWTVLLILAFTGMVWSFQWFQNTVYVLASQSITPPARLEATSTVSANRGGLDQALAKARALYPHASAFGVSRPTTAAGTIRILAQEVPGTYYKHGTLLFDQYSGQLLAHKRHEDKNFGEQLITANYDIHVGAILGLPGKILAFFGSLIAASLPVTGFLVWWGRRNKGSRKAAARSVATSASAVNRKRVKPQVKVKYPTEI